MQDMNRALFSGSLACRGWTCAADYKELWRQLSLQAQHTTGNMQVRKQAQVDRGAKDMQELGLELDAPEH
jgi:hypothetical protein